jgi:hypothetical protein
VLEIAALLQRRYALTLELACISAICLKVDRAIADTSDARVDLLRQIAVILRSAVTSDRSAHAAVIQEMTAQSHAGYDSNKSNRAHVQKV